MQHGTGSTDCNTVHRKLRYFTLTDDESFYHVFKRFLFVHQRFLTSAHHSFVSDVAVYGYANCASRQRLRSVNRGHHVNVPCNRATRSARLDDGLSPWMVGVFGLPQLKRL